MSARMNYFLILFVNLIACNASDWCNSNGPYCGTHGWSTWSNCTATCGGGQMIIGQMTKQKYICCNLKLYNTLSQCLNSCGITHQWWQEHSVQTKSCGKCGQHGVFNASLKRCVCNRNFGGSCCDGKLSTKRFN